MLFTWQGLLVWTQQDTTITLDNRDVLLAGVHHTMVPQWPTNIKNYVSILCIHLQAMHVNNTSMFYAPHASIVVWKSQIGAKSLVNLGTGKKLTCFDPLRKGCRIFF